MTIKKYPWIVVLSTLLILIVLLSNTILTLLGSVLLEKESPKNADYIVVLQGSIPDRMIHGVNLYKEGYADTILMVESRSFSNYDLIEKHDLNISSSADINKEIALQMGAFEDDLIKLSGKAASTRQEAKIINNHLEDTKNKTILLVTSEFHSNRAKLIFQDVFEHLEVVSTPTPYDPFCTDTWWKDRRQTRNFLMEYLKLINFYTFNI
ncbi:YdcF family protein [Natranaerobius trueperi]|uniref:DUF218 domain-containing protein n=1 Tax=Natranaerobius trueperi TaxID=759412 RepID=A0A226C1C6_9FIRM|nr:YdcF family protein [Natranaerobius trueperi]OWZ84975.1 hypothetical protein CDO51_00805 [Natranaerobius trueperi]